ncbi:MAG TPA: flagellar biosynthetic protein FliR [Syntrophorhabdaceae bacterium]|jgi:flagellar biosynthetic protein FliR
MVNDLGILGQTFILVFFRVLAILWLLPLFAGTSIPTAYKAALSLIIAFMLLELVNPGDMTMASDVYYLSLLILKEIAVGIAIGFFVRILFTSVQIAGEVISLQAGFGFARFMDPYTQTQVSELSQILNLLALTIFFSVDAHHMVFRGIFMSFKDLPLGGAAFKGPFFEYIIHTTGKVFSLGFKIGAPLIITLFLVELSLGLLSRMVPQVNVFIEGMPLKIMITIAMLAFSLSMLVPLLADMFKGIDTEVPKIMRLVV